MHPIDRNGRPDSGSLRYSLYLLSRPLYLLSHSLYQILVRSGTHFTCFLTHFTCFLTHFTCFLTHFTLLSKSASTRVRMLTHWLSVLRRWSELSQRIGKRVTPRPRPLGTQFTCFTGTKVHIERAVAAYRQACDAAAAAVRYAVYLLYWYKSTHTAAAAVLRYASSNCRFKSMWRHMCLRRHSEDAFFRFFRAVLGDLFFLLTV